MLKDFSPLIQRRAFQTSRREVQTSQFLRYHAHTRVGSKKSHKDQEDPTSMALSRQLVYTGKLISSDRQKQLECIIHQ